MKSTFSRGLAGPRIPASRRGGSLVAGLLLSAAWTLSAVHAQFIAHDLGLGAAYGINDSGTVVGFSLESGSQRAFVYRDGAPREIGSLGADPFSIAYQINSVGTIVGVSYGTAERGIRGFQHREGVMTDVGSLGQHTYANAVNDAGTIVGQSVKDAPGFPSRAFVLAGGVLTDLGTLGGNQSAAIDLNASGTIVGASEVRAGSGETHAFRFEGGVFTDLGTLGGVYSQAQGVNDSGQIVGWSQTAGNGPDHAFSWREGVMIDLGTLGGSSSLANAVNSAGTIIGHAQTADGASHAFRHDGQGMVDLAPYLAAIGLTGRSEALGINSRGDIVGMAEDASGRGHGFLLTVPEPSWLGLLGLGVFTRAAWGRIRPARPHSRPPTRQRPGLVAGAPELGEEFRGTSRGPNAARDG